MDFRVNVAIKKNTFIYFGLAYLGGLEHSCFLLEFQI